MQFHFMGARTSSCRIIFKNLSHSGCDLSAYRTCLLSMSSIDRYTLSLESRRTTTYSHSQHHETATSLRALNYHQAHPLSGYYYEILSSRSPYAHQATSRPVPDHTGALTQSVTVEPQSPQDKMSIVFGTRLAGPGRSSRYDPGATPPESMWKTINGVAIPPRPEEPGNCCMSGCVHCVWDDYRDEMEEWAARLEQAKTKGASKGPTEDMRHTPRAEVESASTSIDDDGGGSETGWDVTNQTGDLFASIPVGIREFMKTEKKLKQRHQQEEGRL
ncbi:oxidoreductase-like protein [Aspergillus avenaceus]|uniref:Oxidoreductase-like protein n=1 Tax=Aspergillus avenaceus TaxID=36643 RepID=A0A5N6TJ01_ASPAV|nr:oxidoreductase-like protein [Aspergillus avenaceus]